MERPHVTSLIDMRSLQCIHLSTFLTLKIFIPDQISYSFQSKTANMGRRDRLISTSILRAIFRPKQTSPDKPLNFVGRILAFFSVFHLPLARYRAGLFKKLRNEAWGIDETEYTESFRSQSNNRRTDLIAIGDLGYSGSVCVALACPII
jgi:hypothetical protein